MDREDFEKVHEILEKIGEFCMNDIYRYGWLSSDIAGIAEILDKYRTFEENENK